MINISSTSTHLLFSDGGDFNYSAPKSKIHLTQKRDHVIFSFASAGIGPASLKFHYSEVDTPETISGSALFTALNAMLLVTTTQAFTAIAAQTVFTVTNFTADDNSKVFVAGALTTAGFTRSGNVFTFTSAPGAGVQIVIMQ